jgi:hypothetical protein
MGNFCKTFKIPLKPEISIETELAQKVLAWMPIQIEGTQLFPRDKP